MDIADVVKRSGVPASTLRFYEEKGLVASNGRHGLRRQYDADVLERLALISLGRVAGFSLDEIGGMFAPSGKRSPRRPTENPAPSSLAVTADCTRHAFMQRSSMVSVFSQTSRTSASSRRLSRTSPSST